MGQTDVELALGVIARQQGNAGAGRPARRRLARPGGCRHQGLVTEGVQHTLYKGLIAPLALFGGLVMLARRSVKKDDATKSEEDRPS